MLGMRERLPLSGFAGGLPGANTRFALHRANGQVEAVSGHADALTLRDDEWFESTLAAAADLATHSNETPTQWRATSGSHALVSPKLHRSMGSFWMSRRSCLIAKRHTRAASGC